MDYAFSQQSNEMNEPDKQTKKGQRIRWAEIHVWPERPNPSLSHSLYTSQLYLPCQQMLLSALLLFSCDSNLIRIVDGKMLQNNYDSHMDNIHSCCMFGKRTKHFIPQNFPIILEIRCETFSFQYLMCTGLRSKFIQKNSILFISFDPRHRAQETYAFTFAFVSSFRHGIDI